MAKLTPQLVKKAVALRSIGAPLTDVAKECGISVSTIRLWQKAARRDPLSNHALFIAALDRAKLSHEQTLLAELQELVSDR